MTDFNRFTCKLGALICISIIAAFFLTCEPVPDHCGRAERYDPQYQFCFAGKAHNLCNGSSYNPLTHGCTEENEVGTKCADTTIVKLGTPCNGYTLTTASAPEEGGDIVRTPNNTNFPAGEQVALSAVAKEGYTFAGWAGALTDPNETIAVTMNRNTPLIAMFKPNTQTLATTAFPPTGGSIERTENGEQVTVTAKPEEDHSFTNWAGASTSTEPTITVTVDEGKTLVAIFTPATYTLTVNANPATAGTVFVNNTAANGATSHDAGARIEVMARAEAGYAFMGWSGTSTSTSHTITITAGGSNQTLTANFRQQGQGTVTPPPPSGERFTDTRDGKSYRMVRIGEQVWMAENLNYEASGSLCYDNDPDNCEIYGRLYTWAMAMGFGASCNTSSCSDRVEFQHRGICPDGWHVATRVEWGILINFVGSLNGRMLLAANGWNEIHGTDDFGFSALPGGRRWNGEFDNAGHNAYWWNAEEYPSNEHSIAYNRSTTSTGIVQLVGSSKTGMFSLRCVQNVNTFTDPRDNQTYRTVKIGDQTWMAENLNYADHTEGQSWCYDDLLSNCGMYGRLYNWDAAMSACPDGWWLPTRQEWGNLIQIAGGSVAGTNLKSKTGWSNRNDGSNGNGADEFGFSALPGGYRSPGGILYGIGTHGSWWSATEGTTIVSNAWYRRIFSNDDNVHDYDDGKNAGFSVRCAKN